MVEYKAVKNSGESEREEHPEVVQPETVVLIIDAHPALYMIH